MTPEEIASEVEIELNYASDWLGDKSVERNRAVIAKAIAAERERCAKIAESGPGPVGKMPRSTHLALAALSAERGVDEGTAAALIAARVMRDQIAAKIREA